MARTKIGANAIFTSSGLGLNYVSDRCYAYSGSINNAGTGSASTTLLNFNTGEHVIVGTLDFTNINAAGHDTYLDIFFNGIEISATKEANASLVPWRFHILIPPLTEVIVKWGSNSAYDGSVMLVGRVYDA